LTKEEIDQLYHLLRRASNIAEDSRFSGGLTPSEQISVFYGLCRHLLAGGDYQALLRFSQFYGEQFLLQPTFEAIRDAGWKPKRFVEFGAGFGWLARGLAGKFGLLPVLLVDKRPWPLIDLVEDLETEEGIDKVKACLDDGDVIVACDFLHCVELPRSIMKNFSKWPTVVLEYLPSEEELLESFLVQITRYGASPLASRKSLQSIFEGRDTKLITLDPYVLMLVAPEGGKVDLSKHR